jgi:hypothetical protein
MTDSNPHFGRLAVFVIDVQKYLISGPDAVPDASQIRQAISDTLESVRQHNDLVEPKPHGSARKTRIIFVQHDDKDPNDSLYKGKPIWELEFNPRKDDDAEVLVSKDVRTCPLAKHDGVHCSLSKLIKTRQRIRK